MKKALSIIKKVLVWIVVVFAVAVMLFTVVSTIFFSNSKDGSVDDKPAVFGIKMYIVLSDSMRATDFDAGDLVFSKELSEEEKKDLRPGDIITFRNMNPESAFRGQIVSHKIRSVVTLKTQQVVFDEAGNKETITVDELAFITYGTTTDTDDSVPVASSDVIGKYVGHLPKVGWFFKFLKTTPGYVIFILLPFLILIMLQVWNSVSLFRKYKAEQNMALEAEREQLAAERAEAQRMLEELRAMKAEMNPTDRGEDHADKNETDDPGTEEN